MVDQQDRAIRAIDKAGAFRVITLRTSAAAAAAAAAQRVTGAAAGLFAELLTGAILVRETMAPGLHVQCMISGATGGSMVADSHPDGLTRGIVTPPPDGGELVLGESSLLKVVRVMPRGTLHDSVVRANPEGGVSGALMEYFKTSEQIASMIVVGSRVVQDDLKGAGGYIVQLLPELREGHLAIMTERLEDFRSIAPMLHERDSDPAWLLSELLYGFPHTVLEESAVHFGCNCGPVRVLSAMATLGRDDIEHLLADGTVLDVDCDYCGRQYQVGPEQVRGLLEPPS